MTRVSETTLLDDIEIEDTDSRFETIGAIQNNAENKIDHDRVVSNAKMQTDRELERREEEKQNLRNDRDYHRQEKYAESDSIQTELAEAEERVAAKQTQVEAVRYLLCAGYQPPGTDIDYDRLSDDSYEYHHGDVIQMALDDDEMPKKIEGQLQWIPQPNEVEGASQ